MAVNTSLGARGEDLATQHLISKGYTIRERNWRSGRTEIDIIAETSDFIVFVEVKTRSGNYLVHPAEAVNVPKQRTIIYAASNYIRQHNLAQEARFDIITIIFDRHGPELDHIENAYYPTM